MSAKYKSFYFYPAFLEIMSELPPESQDEFLAAVICYGTEEAYSISDPIVGACFAQCRASIDSSRKRYNESSESGKRGGRPREIDDSFIVNMYRKGFSKKEIADMANCSVRSVQRIIRKKKYELEDLLFERRRKYKLRPKNDELIDYYYEQHPMIERYSWRK